MSVLEGAGRLDSPLGESVLGPIVKHRSSEWYTMLPRKKKTLCTLRCQLQQAAGGAAAIHCGSCSVCCSFICVLFLLSFQRFSSYTRHQSHWNVFALNMYIWSRGLILGAGLLRMSAKYWHKLNSQLAFDEVVDSNSNSADEFLETRGCQVHAPWVQ